LEKVQEEKLIEIKIDNLERKHFILKEKENELSKLDYNFVKNKPMKFLTPFDNAIRDRDLLLRIWDFDYKIECYTPVAQRVYGYFTLPILDGHSFIGRTDLKVHRKDEILEMKSIHFEDWFKPTVESNKRLADGLGKFADFHNCSKIKLENSIPNTTRKSLSAVLNSSYLT